jgi:hypothetical protein
MNTQDITAETAQDRKEDNIRAGEELIIPLRQCIWPGTITVHTMTQKAYHD